MRMTAAFAAIGLAAAACSPANHKTGGTAEAQLTQLKLDLSAPNINKDGDGPYIVPEWSYAARLGVTLSPRINPQGTIRALQAYGFVMRHVPDVYFQDFKTRAYYASLVNCGPIAQKQGDEFAFRDAVEQRFSHMKKTLAAMPATNLKAVGYMQLGQYDFATGRFPLKGPYLDGWIIRNLTTRPEIALPLWECDPTFRMSNDGREIRSVSVRMTPMNFDTPTVLEANEEQARKLISLAGAERKLPITLEYRQQGPNGIKRHRDNQPGFVASASEGPFIDVAIVDWKITAQDGTAVASRGAGQTFPPR